MLVHRYGNSLLYNHVRSPELRQLAQFLRRLLSMLPVTRVPVVVIRRVPVPRVPVPGESAARLCLQSLQPSEKTVTTTLTRKDGFLLISRCDNGGSHSGLRWGSDLRTRLRMAHGCESASPQARHLDARRSLSSWGLRAVSSRGHRGSSWGSRLHGGGMGGAGHEDTPQPDLTADEALTQG